MLKVFLIFITRNRYFMKSIQSKEARTSKNWHSFTGRSRIDRL